MIVEILSAQTWYFVLHSIRATIMRLYGLIFLSTLQMVKLEFAHYDYKLRGTISAKDFALSMVASADLKHLSKLLDRVDDLDHQPNIHNIRITPEEFKSFAEIRKKLQPFSLALFSFGHMNGLLTRKDLQRAAQQVGPRSLLSARFFLLFLKAEVYYKQMKKIPCSFFSMICLLQKQWEQCSFSWVH